MFTGLGKLVANKFLRFPRGSNRSSYTQLYIAFFLSGVIHSSGDFMLENRMVYQSFKFFLLQAVVITFEDLVIRAAKRMLLWGGIELKPGRVDECWAEVVVRFAGYLWVILWFCLSLPIWTDEASVTGVNSVDRWRIAQFLLETWEKRA
jgi:hypothetical protein